MVHLFSRILLLLLIGVSIESLKILFISPMMGKSHLNFVGRSADILVAAGHNVTLIAVPVDTQIKSTGTKLAHVVQLPRSEKVDTIWAKINNMGKSLWQHEGGNPLSFLSKAKIFIEVNVASCENVVQDDEFTKWMINEKFDIGVTESFDMCAFGVFKMYKVPVTNEKCIKPLCNEIVWRIIFTNATKILDDKLGTDVVNIEEEIRDIAFHMSNEDPYIALAYPLLSKVVEVGGFSVLPAKKLLAEWDVVLNKNKYNVLVSFGSNARSVDIPKDIRNALLATFKKLSHVTFIWKYEEPTDGTCQDLDNCHLYSWLDQTAILNDSRVEAFITHGGLNSVTESAIYGTN